MRLDRYLSHVTDLTRAQAQRSIRSGAVIVDGVTTTDPARHLTPSNAVVHKGERLSWPQPRYFMLHKPSGYVCTARDARHRSALDLLDEPRKRDLHCVGRLDLDTTGLVLITDDGEWSHGITAPRRAVEKVYRVTLADILTKEAAQVLCSGVQLRGEPQPCRPAKLEVCGQTEWRVTLTEGKYHEVKRLFAAVGNHVLSLHRERIGAVQLDSGLDAGGYRPLAAHEVECLRAKS